MCWVVPPLPSSYFHFSDYGISLLRSLHLTTSAPKTLLESQGQAYRDPLEIIIKQVNGNTSTRNCKVTEITTSLEFIQKEVDDLKGENKQYKHLLKTDSDVITKLQKNLQASVNCISTLECRVNC